MSAIEAALVGAAAAIGIAAYNSISGFSARHDHSYDMQVVEMRRLIDDLDNLRKIRDMDDEDYALFTEKKDIALQSGKAYRDSIAEFKSTTALKPVKKLKKRNDVRKSKRQVREANQSLQDLYYHSYRGGSDASSVTTEAGSPPESQGIREWPDMVTNSDRQGADLDEDQASTSHILKPGGIPKRPMNAFMIFAHGRRPLVAAENQAMRTGEIRKILGNEWLSLPSSEKQFYLDQAKQLKEIFNTKYPDYVYRHRPNNSGRRSWSDGAIRPADALLDGSCTAADETLEPPSSYQHSQDAGFIGPSKHDVGQLGSSIHAHSSSDPHFRSSSHHDSRNMPYPSPTDLLHSTFGSNSSPRHPHISGSLNYAYVTTPSHSQTSPGFGHDSLDNQQEWLERLFTGWTENGHDSISGPPASQQENCYSSSTSNPE